MIETPIIHYLIAAVSGAFGVGVAWGSVKVSLTKDLASLREDITKIQIRQARLRGEDDGGEPMFVPSAQCTMKRKACHDEVDKTSVELARKAVVNAERIKRLENYARWTLQDKGLRIDQINNILDPIER